MHIENFCIAEEDKIVNHIIWTPYDMVRNKQYVAHLWISSLICYKIDNIAPFPAKFVF